MSEEPLSIINEDGSCADEHRDLIPDADVESLLRLMVFNRVFDRRMLMLQRQGRLGFYMTSTGEEAAIIGAAYSLEKTDPIFISYRELGALLWRGVPLPAIMNQLIGNNQDPSLGRQMPVHYCYREHHIPSVSSPVCTQVPQATGLAYAAKLRGTGQVALAFLGEGTASEGDFHVGVNFSGVWAAPVIFLIRNNGYAISTPESVQTAAESLASRAIGYGIAGERIDGLDLLAVVKTVREAARRARAGEGPTLIEALTYRIGAHSSADDPSRYRSEDETKQWLKVDALARLRAHAKWRGVWTDEIEQEVKEQAEKDITQLIAECERWPPPPVESLFDDVYATIPAHLQEQKDDYLAFLRERKAAKGG